jgi:uncharacterized Zn finger protein
VKLAGERTYERGLASFEEDRVGQIESSERKTAATVHGTEPYRVELQHTRHRLEGACECPASQGIDFCKHCVALALVLQARQIDGARLRTASDDDKIRAYLALQSPEALVSELLDVLPKLPELRQRLMLKTEIAAGSVSARHLKKAITQVTRPRSLWEYRQVAAYFRQIETTFENVASIAGDLPAEALLEVVLYGIERVDRALEQVDDSGGYRFTAQALLRQLHGIALARLEWSPERRAAHVLDLALRDPWDQFSNVPGAYAEALGEDGLAAFYTKVEERLNAMPGLPSKADFDEKYPYLCLTRWLEVRAEENEDWGTLIELKKRTATSERDYQQLAAVYLRKDDPDGAAEWLSKADALTKGSGVESSLWIDVHVAREDWGAAVEAQRYVLDRQPNYADYTRLIDFATHAGRAEVVRGEAKAALQAGSTTSSWIDELSAYTLAQILRDERKWNDIYEVAIGRVREADRLVDVARWLSEPAPAHACELYERAVEAHIEKKNKRGYKAAIEVLLEAKPVFESVDAQSLPKYLATLRQNHKQKRSFISTLDGAVKRWPSVSGSTSDDA